MIKAIVMMNMKRFVCRVFMAWALLAPTLLSAAESGAGQTLRDENKARYAYYEAMRCKGSGQHAEAFDLLRYALSLDTTLAAAYSEVAGYYFSLRDAETGYRSLLRAVDFAPDNRWYILSAAECARQVRDYSRADSLYGMYLALRPSDFEVLMRRSEVCLLRGQPQRALDAYNRFEEQYGASESTILQKARIYHLMQAREQSYEEMERLIAENPRNVAYVILLGDLYLDGERYDDAYRTYMQARAVDPENESLHLSLLNYYRKKDDWTSYLQQADTVLFHSDFPVDTRLSVLPYVVQILAEDSARLDTLMTRLCDLYPNDADLRKLYSEILIHAGDYTRAQEQLEVAIDIAPDEDLWQRLFSILAEKNDNEALIEAARRAIAQSPDVGRYYLIIASSQLVAGRYDEAEATLQAGLDVPKIGSDPLMRSEFYTLYGDIAFRRDMTDEAFAYYDKALENNPKNYGALNNYSYYLALLGRDLDKAERMSGEVIKANPENATYLDTYAWVYFKQGRYALARLYLKKAIDLSNEASAEMYEHYGDVLAVTGQEAEAVEWWKKALEAGGDSELLRRKISLKKYVENE